MQNNEWIDVFRVVPVEQHNTLVLTTPSGVDLTVESILRRDPTVMVFRGRVSGSTDDGRVFFLPYRQIDFVQINRFMKEAEVVEMFEKAAPPPPPKPASAQFPVRGPTPSAIYSSTGTAASHHGT